jgi:ectoine hydroxylase-related dioxygenase (phytanoyl-CoA dioxygenase family)
MGKAVRDEFWTKGFVIVRQALSAGQLNAIRDQVDEYLTAAAAPVTEVAPADSDAGRYVYGHGVLAWVYAFAAALRDGPLVPGIQRALGCDGPLTLLDDQAYVKEPGTRGVTPWHQDASYWATSGRELCTAWLALDSVTAGTGGLEFVVGSHLWERAYRAPAFTAGQLVGDPADPAVPADSEIREQHVVAAPDLAAGDAVVFHAALLHGAGPNLSADLRRRALVTRWAGADVRFEPRPCSSARQVAKAARNGVQAGEPFGGPEYPRYQAAGLHLEREHAR